MKKLIVTFFIAIAVFSCKNDKKTDTSIEGYSEQNIREISGNFFNFEDAAVLQTKNELFGVIKNKKEQELISTSKEFKNEPTDEVAVTLKVKVSNKPVNEEGWDKRVEIIEIIKVSEANPNDNDIVKLDKKK